MPPVDRFIPLVRVFPPVANLEAYEITHKTPHFKQGDKKWAKVPLGPKGATIAKSGCAMTAAAMALSYATQRWITPVRLDMYLDSYDGYFGDGIIWQRAGDMVNMNAVRISGGVAEIDAALALNAKVIVGVDYKRGTNGGANGTDHWLLITDGTNGRYTAHDPETGKEITLKPSNGQLKASGGLHAYVTTGEIRYFVAK